MKVHDTVSLLMCNQVYFIFPSNVINSEFKHITLKLVDICIIKFAPIKIYLTYRVGVTGRRKLRQVVR